MIDGIVKKVFRRCMENGAKLNSVSVNEIQLLIKVKPVELESGDLTLYPVYKIITKAGGKEYQYNELYQATLDLMNTEQICAQYIPIYMVRLAERLGIEILELSVLTYINANGLLSHVIYHGREMIREIDLEEFLS